MKSKLIIRTLQSALIVLLFFSFLMVTPRMIGWLFPKSLPVGYHFDMLAYLAVGAGLEKLANLNPEVPAEIEEIKDVEYKLSNGKSLQLDFYKPRHVEAPLPLLVFIHGGSWKGGKRSDYLVYLLHFAGKGYMTATVSYRLLRDSIYPAAVQDVTDAVRWLSENGGQYGYDPNRIALVGGSAGAHLAMLAGYGWSSGSPSTDNLDKLGLVPGIKAVVNIYGPVDLTTPYARNQPLVKNFLGHSFEDSPELYKYASPVTWLHDSCPPTLILHGTSDNLVPVSQADMLKEKLDSLGIPVEYYRLPFWPHAMDVAKRVNDFAAKQMEAFFEKHVL